MFTTTEGKALGREQVNKIPSGQQYNTGRKTYTSLNIPCFVTTETGCRVSLTPMGC